MPPATAAELRSATPCVVSDTAFGHTIAHACSSTPIPTDTLITLDTHPHAVFDLTGDTTTIWNTFAAQRIRAPQTSLIAVVHHHALDYHPTAAAHVLGADHVINTANPHWRDQITTASTTTKTTGLSDQRLRIMYLLRRGALRRDIATTLSVSEETIATHLSGLHQYFTTSTSTALIAAGWRTTGVTTTPAPTTPQPKAPTLTPRQKAILTCLATGADKATTATCVGISPWTVREHLRAAAKKFIIPDGLLTAAVVSRAAAYGLISLHHTHTTTR